MHQYDTFAPTTLGERLRERDYGWFGVTEARHGPNEILHPHAHRYPAITIVRRGSFGLRIGRDSVACNPSGVFFKRGGHRHSNIVGPAGSLSLILELRTDDAHIEQRNLAIPGESFWIGDPIVRRLAASIGREFRGNDIASELALEGLLLELVAQLLRRGRADRPDAVRPSWLREVEAILHERFREAIGLRDVAESIGRDPAHLARTFRRHHGCSLGEYLRGVRLEYAAEYLRDSDRAIADIALDTGFFDQSHFGRCFKAWMSITPQAYRSALREE